MDAKFLNALIEWQKQYRRQVDISIGNAWKVDEVKVYCYDFELSEGAFIDSIEELESLDLIAKKRQDLEKKIKELESL